MSSSSILLGAWDTPASPGTSDTPAAAASPAAVPRTGARPRAAASRTSSGGRASAAVAAAPIVLALQSSLSNPNNVSARPPPTALSARPQAGGKHQPVLLNLADAGAEEEEPAVIAAPSPSQRSARATPRSQRSSALAGAFPFPASASSALAATESAAGLEVAPAQPAPGAAAAATTQGMRGSLRPSPPPPPAVVASSAAAAAAAAAPAQLSLTGIQSPHALSRVLSAASIGSAAAVVPSTATSVLSASPSTAQTNVIVSQAKDRAAALNTHMIAVRARESNLASSLTGYLQNQLSLFSKRGHAREVLQILEARQAQVLNAPPTTATAAATPAKEASRTTLRRSLAVDSGSSGSVSGSRSDLLKPPVSPLASGSGGGGGGGRSLSAVSAAEEQATQQPPQSLISSGSQDALFVPPPHQSRGGSRGAASRTQVFAPLPVGLNPADRPVAAALAPFAPALAPAAAIVYPEGSSNPYLPPLPVARLNLPSEHLHGQGSNRTAVDSLATKAARQYAALAAQASYLRDLEAKEDSALRSSFLGSAHAALVGVDTWSPPVWVRSSEDDGRDRWGRKFLAGLGSDVEKAVRFAHLAVNQGDPVPNAPALRAMLARYNAAVPRDYRPAVAAGSAGVGVGAERNAALDFDSLKGRRQWEPVLQLARREQSIKERSMIDATYASGSQSARGSGGGSHSALPSAQTQALRLRLPAEPPSQATATNPPRPARSFRRNMHSLAYRLNDGSMDATNSMTAAARGSQSARAQHACGYNHASPHSSGAAPFGHSVAIDQQAHPGLSALAPSLPSQPLVSNIYSTGGFTLSDLASHHHDAAHHSYAGFGANAGAVGSYSATGGFQRVPASLRNAFLAASFAAAADDDAGAAQMSAEEFEQHAARALWRQEMSAGADQILTSTPHAGDSRLRSLSKKKPDEVLVAVTAPAAPAVGDDGSLASLLDFSDRNGSTSLFHASWEGYTAILRLLCEYGASVNARNVRQHSAMDMAVERGHADVVRILLRFGADSTRAEGAAARKRCRARLGNNYALWLKRMKLGGWMSDAGELLLSNVKTGALPPTDAESLYFTPLHRDLRAQDTSILRLFAHTVFWPDIVRPDLGAIMDDAAAGMDERDAEQEQDEWTIAAPRPATSFVPFQPPPLRHLTREARLARVCKLREARAKEMQHKAEFRVAAGLDPVPVLPQPQHQRSLLLATPNVRGARRSSGSLTPRGGAATTLDSAESKQAEPDEAQGGSDAPRAPYKSILTILPRVREHGSSTAERDEFEEAIGGGSARSVAQYERDIAAVQSALDKRDAAFYVDNAQAVLELDAQRRQAYTALERWADQLELYNAVLTGNLTQVESILAAHPEHAAFVGHGCSLLYHAAYHGHYAIARALLAAAAESKMEAAVLAAAKRTTAGDDGDDADRSSETAFAASDPVVVFDLSSEGHEKPAAERRVNYFHPLFTGAHPSPGIVDASRLNAAVPLGCGSPALLDVNYLCVDELRSSEEHRADEQMRARFDTLAEHRRLRRALAEKRAARLRIKALEKSSRKALNISDSDSSSDEDDIAAAAAGTAGSSAHGSARSSGGLTKLHASATLPLTGSPKDAIVAPPPASSASARAAKIAAAQAKRDAADQAQLALDAEIDAEFALPPAVQIWHRWLVDPVAWNRLRMRQAREQTAAARSEAVAIGVASGATSWDALEEDQRLASYEARRERDREAAEDAALRAAKEEAERQRRPEATAPPRWETAIYVALKRKHYRLALLLHSQGAISPYSRAEILQMCDVQLRAREIMRAIHNANYPALQALLTSACTAKRAGAGSKSNSGPGSGLLAQVLSYQDASRGGHNPLLLCIGSNDLRAMELVRAATATQPGGTHMLHRLLSGIKDRLGYSAIDTSLLSAAASGGTAGGSGLAGALALTDASTSSSIAMTSFLLNLGGLALSTGTILDLVLNKHGAADGSDNSTAAAAASAAQQGVSVNYAGLEALKRIMVQTSLASAKSAAAQVAAECSQLGGSRGRLVSPSLAASASKEKDVIDFAALFAALESNVHHLRPEQLADLREHLRAVEREHDFMKTQRAKAVAAARAEAAKSSSNSGSKRGSGSNKQSPSSSPMHAARQLLSFPRRADEDEMSSILEGVESDEYSPRLSGGGGGGGAGGGFDDSELQEQTARLQRALTHLDEEDARKLATAQAQREKLEALKTLLASDVRIAAGATARIEAAGADSDSSSDDEKDEVAQALVAGKRASKRSSAAATATAGGPSAVTDGAASASSALPAAPSSRPLTGATDTSDAVSSSSENDDDDDDDGGTIPDWTKEIHEEVDSRRASSNGTVAILGSKRASMHASLANRGSGGAGGDAVLRIDGAGGGAVLLPSSLKAKPAATAASKKKQKKSLHFAAVEPSVLRPPVIQPLAPVTPSVAAAKEPPLDLLPLELKARLIWMLDSIQSGSGGGEGGTVDPQLLGVGVASAARNKEPLSALEIVATMQAMQFPTDEPKRETKRVAPSQPQQQRPGSGLLRVAPSGGRGAHARTYSAAIPSFFNPSAAAPLLPSVDRPASPSSASSSSSAPATLIDVTMLKWANLLRINPHLSCLLGVDYPAEPARAKPPSAEDLAASIVTTPAAWSEDDTVRGIGNAAIQSSSSRRGSQESYNAAAGSLAAAARKPAIELRADPALRTVTVDSWLESFQRLARSHPMGVLGVRDALDEFDRVSRVAEQEMSRQRARKEAELAAESLRIAAAEQALKARSHSRIYGSSYTPAAGPTVPAPPSFLASRLAMYRPEGKQQKKKRAFDDPAYSSSDEDDDQGATATRREMRAPSPASSSSSAQAGGTGVSNAETATATAIAAAGGHASIFTFVPHLDPSVAGAGAAAAGQQARSQQPQHSTGAASSLPSPVDAQSQQAQQTMAASSGLTQQQHQPHHHEKKSVRWRGSLGSDRSSASSSSLLEHAPATTTAVAALSADLRSSMQRTAAGLLHERGLSGV